MDRVEDRLKALEAAIAASAAAYCPECHIGYPLHDVRCAQANSDLVSKAEQRTCQTCDGSGDVHRADGEWMGRCPECHPAAEQAQAKQGEQAEREAFRDFYARRWGYFPSTSGLEWEAWQAARSLPRQALTDAQLHAVVLECCHSDPMMASGEYCLTFEELRAVAQHITGGGNV